ncbi:MAG: iron ABC transporter permease [Bacteroidota bacterium]
MRPFWSILLLSILLLLTILAGLMLGVYDFSLGEIFQILGGAELSNSMVILDLRLPRILQAIITGAVLSLAGFYMQALIKNPLADPYIMGLTAGAGLGVNLVILGLIPLGTISAFSYPLFATLGGVASLILVLGFGFRALFEDNAKLLIAGVAVSAIFSALTGVLIYTQADSDQISRLVFWTFGSFSRARWESVQVSGLMLGLAIVFGFIYARKMDVLALGDRQAQSLGLRVSRFKFGLLLISSVVVGGTVAYTGPIGFVGMMIPHACRSLFGSAHRPNIIAGALLGGIFIGACDVFSRWIWPPVGLPIGIITAILGVPFFLYVLFSSDSKL